MRVPALSMLALLLIAAMPLRVSAQSADVEEVTALLDQLAAQVEASEAEPFGDETEGAAQARLAELTVALQERDSRMADRQERLAAAIAVIEEALPAFPAAAVP